MELLYQILIIAMIILILTNMKIVEHFYSIMTSDKYVQGTNSLDEKQRIQGMIFHICMNRMKENESARNVLLLKEKDILPIENFRNKIDTIEKQLEEKQLALQNELCYTFKGDYCMDETMQFNEDERLYDIDLKTFNDKMDECYSLCYEYDMDKVRDLRKMLYNGLFDIFLRYKVLENIEGDVLDNINANRYQYLINFASPESIDISTDLSTFSKKSKNHVSFVNELYRFMKIINLESDIIDVNNVIHQDRKSAIQNNFFIQKNKITNKPTQIE